MGKEEIISIIESQKEFFATGKTLDIGYRLEILKKLKSLIILHEPDIIDALWKDFHKPEFEVIGTETGLVLKELNFTIRNLRKWTRKERVRTPLIHFLSRSYILFQPYGQILILSPWNFPFQLAFVPLLGALAAGNCVILKTSRQVPAINAVMNIILKEFPKELVAMIDGDHSVSDFLLDRKFDYIFFTGSHTIGKHVLQKAAQNLTHVSLELGGKNPCVVTADASLELAAKRIVWGKFFNCGQACVGPDYLIVDRKIRDSFIDLLVNEIKLSYGENPEESNDFARVISAGNVNRLATLMEKGTIVTGGTINQSERYVAPTIIKDIKVDDPIMQEEIFGPILPVLEFEKFEDVYSIIGKNPKPLSTYIFSRNRLLIKEFLNRTQSGNSGVNETVMQFGSPYLPFGGVGTSGMGRYHGKKSFETFSNLRSVLVKSNLIDPPVRYPPYTKLKTKIVRLLMR